MSLHQIFKAAMDAAKSANRPALSAGSVEAARTMVDDGAKLLGDGPFVEHVETLVVPSRGGGINGVLYRPTPEVPGLLVYFHGGGWVAGSASGFDALGRTLAIRTGCGVLLIDYRLAPEHPFPAGLEDATDAVKWAYQHLTDIAGPGARLLVGGDSAGANLATVAALALGQKVPIALQVLLYPVTDANMETASYLEHGNGLPLTKPDMKWFFEKYAPRDQWVNPAISPLRADLENAPPAWIGLAEYDVLRTEGEAYAQKLESAGVAVQSKTYSDLTHGFARWFNLVDSASQALDDAATAIKAQLGRA